ncbi:DsbA family protein [Boseongicola sp. H5]|uniref:DsbA family oxidoreductase n=1 Tax=Boseongicola sp. H5 TaxID=2763261 RepID=UPI001D0A34BC|nr:DsbA family protein [Boseongicola sp. H5]
MKKIHVYSDFVCPYCLLADKILTPVAEEENAEIVWHPFELRPDPVPTLKVEDPYLPSIWERSVYPMAKRLGQPIRLPSTSPQPRSELAFQGFAFAQDHNLGHAYTMRIFEAFFVEDCDIGDIDVIVEAGVSSGLHGDLLRRSLQEGNYRQQHAEALRHATKDVKVQSVPTIIIGETRIEGVPDAEQMRRALWNSHSEETA